MKRDSNNERKSGPSPDENRRIVLCDGELAYAERLSEHLLRSRTLPWGTAVYSSREKLLARCDPGETALLVIAQSQYDRSLEQA